MSDRPDGAPAVGTVVAHAEAATLGKIIRYYPPGAYTPPQAMLDVIDGLAAPPPIDAWCVELDSGDVLLWRPDSFETLTPAEVELLGGAASGLGTLFKALFAQAKAKGVPFGRALTMVSIAMQSQLAAIGRAIGEADAKKSA